jgi:hypothetical protein
MILKKELLSNVILSYEINLTLWNLINHPPIFIGMNLIFLLNNI